ncbi:MAG: hypothetical protein ACI4JM_08060 [Oscillospiraceae bacterium]
MDFFSVGKLNNYVKTNDMQAKWQKKKKSGNFTADGITTMSEYMRKKENDMKQAADIYNRSNENKDDKLTSIYSKIQNGTELSHDELEYLKEKSPAAYQQVKQEMLEKESYEREIKHCRTKDDVQRVKMNHINQSVAAIKLVEHNPNISDGDKLAVAYVQQKKMNDISKITAKFIKSGEYAKLPDESEVDKASKDIKKAEENENQRIYGNSDKTENTVDDSTVKKDITRAEAEMTEEARKIKRSKMKCAYSDSFETEKNIMDIIV